MKLVIVKPFESRTTRVLVELSEQELIELPPHIAAMTKTLSSGEAKKSDVLFVLSEIARFRERREAEAIEATKKSVDE